MAKKILATEGIKIVGYTKACMGIEAKNIPPFEKSRKRRERIS